MTTFSHYVTEIKVTDSYADLIDQLVDRRNELGYGKWTRTCKK